MTKLACALVVSLLAASCSRVAPERQLVLDAAGALGGLDRIQAMRSLQIEGEGESPNVGQNTMPDGDLPVWKVSDYTRTIDLVNGRVAVRQARTAQFLFALAGVQRQHTALDGDVAFNLDATGQAVRAGNDAARESPRAA